MTEITNWYHVKQWLVIVSGLNMDALHVHAGVLCQLVAAFVFRRSLRSPLPWLVVLVAILANEYYDLQFETWPTRDAQFAESAKDIWNTMLLPTILLLLARFVPERLVGTGARGPDVDSEREEQPSQG